MILSFLIDKNNFNTVKDRVIADVRAASFVGLDTETHDDNRHDGLMQYCKYDAETRKKSAATKLVFDMRRTIMTGFSIWPENSPVAYYVNLNHADIENRLPWEDAKQLLDALPESAYFVAHNAAYELTVFKSCYNLDLPRYIDTLQMAVSAFGPDEYSVEEFIAAGQGGIKAKCQALMAQAMYWDTSQEMPPALSETVYSIIAKQSDAAHSYNGFVKQIAYSYGLKKLVKSMFGHQMTTFEETLNGKAHMGQLTGQEVVAYGAEDAYWALRLFRHLLEHMTRHCPTAISTFFNQENPMVQVFADIWTNGLKINTKAVYDRRDSERQAMAEILVNMKETIRHLLPFDNKPSDYLKEEAWYVKNHAKYRKMLEEWAKSDDPFDPANPTISSAYAQCQQVRGAVSNAWASELGESQSKGPNLAHYMPIRVMIYDLLRTKVIRSEGKVQSDGEARGRLKDRMEKLENKHGADLLGYLSKISGVEQRMKLYLTPYTQLMDPETGRMYPVVSSMLASRRMAASFPNPMQLAKRGESTYVRGFFEPDYDDHVIVSIDWSSIELVEIGEFSEDPEFIKAYGQIPHEDLHAGAAAAILGVDVPGLTVESFKDLTNFKTRQEYEDNYGQTMTNYNRLFTDLKGQELDVSKAYKYWRTEVGKGANFNYWYSGFLSTIGERMGWSMDKTGEATERYRNRFHVAEQWRVDLIHEVQMAGKVILPDGHTRSRFEATPMWKEYFLQKFQIPAYGDEAIHRYNEVWNFIARKIQGRANNQTVNSVIQGSCATIAKRSIIRSNAEFKKQGWTNREARFMLPIHDELVFSVHKEIVPEFIKTTRDIMITHPDMFKHCKLDASPSVGLTFEPWNETKATFGQVELFEAPKLDFIPQNKWGNRLNDDETRGVVEYLFEERKKYHANS